MPAPSPPPPLAAKKRKRTGDDNGAAAAQRMAARHLLASADCCDAYDAAKALAESQRGERLGAAKRLRALARLQAAVELATTFHIQWETQKRIVRRSERKKVEAVMTGLAVGYKQRRNALSTERRVVRQLEHVTSDLASVMDRATDALLHCRKRWDVVLSTAASGHSKQGGSSSVSARPSLLPHPRQYVPLVLWKLYQDEYARSVESDRVLRTMQGVIEAVSSADTYFYLKTMYQPPPVNQGGSAAWEVWRSTQVLELTRSLTPFFQELDDRGYWLTSTDPHMRIRRGWAELRGTLWFLRRLAMQFHFVVLSLYSVAMGRYTLDVSAATIDGMVNEALGADVTLRDQLRLSPSSSSSSDYLIQETYDYTPELLVIVDAWCSRNEVSSGVNGFHLDDRFDRYLPVFDAASLSSERPDVLHDIGFELRQMHSDWQRSQLGSSRFSAIGIEEIGAVEQSIKHHLRNVTELVFQMTLARWAQRRGPEFQRQWLEELRLRIRSDDTHDDNTEKSGNAQDAVVPGVTTTTATMEAQDDSRSTEMDQVASEDVQVEANPIPEDTFRRSGRQNVLEGEQDDRFRSPSPLQRSDWISHAVASARASAPRAPLATASAQVDSCKDPVVPRQSAGTIIKLKDIYAWTDDDIDCFERETARIIDVRNELLTLRDALTPNKLEHDATRRLEVQDVSRSAEMSAKGTSTEASWLLTTISSRVRRQLSTVTAFAEEIALHGAAEALIKRPALRISGEGNSDLGAAQAALRVISTPAQLAQVLRVVQTQLSRLPKAATTAVDPASCEGDPAWS